jgi:hypothetical protein
VSRASRSNRAEWLARTEQPPKPVRTNPRHARPPRTATPVDPEYERLHLRCPICGEVMWRPEFRPFHLGLEHGWRLPREFGETVRGIFDEYLRSRRVS